MTVNSTAIVSGPYAGNGVADTFDYDWTITSKSQVSVYETDDVGAVTLLVVDTNYTVNGVGTEGGSNITRVAGPLPTGYIWYIRSNFLYTQLTDLESQGGFFPQVHEASFDKLTYLSQQLRDQLDRAMRFPDSYSGGADLQLPSPEADKTILWNGTGDGLVNGPSVGTFAGYASAAAASETAAANSAAAAAADLVQTNQDTIDTAADLVQTNQDTIDTAADLVQTNLDTIATAADRVQTGLDVVATNADVVLTGLDVVATNADAAATAADVATVAGIYDNFDDRYLGDKASDPTLDNDSNALLTGALYFKTGAVAGMRVYNGSSWEIIAADAVTQDDATGAANLPTGTTAERPSTPAEGMFRRNTTNGAFEGYDGSEWGSVGGASGGAGNPAFYENPTNITADYTISTGTNAMSAGPITIDNGITVTVPSGSVWSII